MANNFKTTIIRTKFETNFVILPNNLFYGDLSPDAVFILGFVYSKSDSWSFTQQGTITYLLERGLKITKERLSKAIKELVSQGYVAYTTKRDELGRVTEHIYLFTLEPEAGKPEAGKPEAGKPEAGKPDTTKEIITKEIITKETNTITPIVPMNGFEEFYDLYPRKVAKGNAHKAWKKLIKQGYDPDKIIDGCRNYQFSEDKMFIKHPASWLNALCFEDEFDVRLSGNQRFEKKDDGKLNMRRAAINAGFEDDYLPSTPEEAMELDLQQRNLGNEPKRLSN